MSKGFVYGSKFTENQINIVYRILKNPCINYTDFKNWYYDKVVKEMHLTNGRSREIIVAYSEDRGFAYATAIAIVKKSLNECKICTFYIVDTKRNIDVGSELMEECFNYLGTRTPLFTISESAHEEFNTLLKKYRFKQTQTLQHYYKQGLSEYVYNGVIK